MAGANLQTKALRYPGLTRLGNESLLCDEIILTQRGKEAEGQRRMKKTLCLCVSVIKLTQRHKGSEAQSLTFLTGLTGLTRLGNESLLCDKKILTQRGKGAEGQRRIKDA